jgi:hypothetical protein
MGKKLTGNGMFESSRFMLPQHKETILNDMRRAQRRSRPNLDADQVNYIAMSIAQAALNKVPITLRVFDETAGDVEICGKIVKVDQQLNRIKVETGESTEFIPFGDILSVVE